MLLGRYMVRLVGREKKKKGRMRLDELRSKNVLSPAQKRD